MNTGDTVQLTLVRQMIYANDNYAPAERETVRRFKVVEKFEGGYILRPCRRGKIPRSFLLAGEYLTSSGRPPLKYLVMKIQ